MHRRRLVTAVAAASVSLVFAMPSGRAAPPGVGEAGGAAHVVQLGVGDGDLHVGVVGEASSTSDDPGSPTAVERVAPLTLASTVVPTLGAASLPAVESSSTGPEHVVGAGPTLDLGAVATPVPGLLQGEVQPGQLRTAVDASGAVAEVEATAEGIGVLAGAVRLGTVSLTARSLASDDQGLADRTAAVDRVEVLDVGSVLHLLGVDITDLPLGVVAGLATALGIELPGSASAGQFVAAVDAMVEAAEADAAAITSQVAAAEATIAGHTTTITATSAQLPALAAAVQAAEAAAAAQVPALEQQLDLLQLQLAGLACAVVPVACDALAADIAAINAEIAALDAAVAAAHDAHAAATTLIDQLLALVDDLDAVVQELRDDLAAVFEPAIDAVDDVLSDLAAVPLLRVDDLEIRALADARATAPSSTAVATGSLGTVSVGEVPVPIGDAVAAIDAVLGAVAPAATGVVDLAVLDGVTSVGDGPTTTADAGITGLRLTVTPGDVCALHDAVAAAAVDGTLGDLLAQMGAPPPAPPGIAEALAVIGTPAACGVLALAEPLTLEVLELRSDGAFTAAPAPSDVPATDPVPPTTTTAAPMPTTPVPPSSRASAPASSPPASAPSGPRDPGSPHAAPQRPGTAAPPGRMAPTPALARTGGSGGAALVGLALLAVGVALRRAVAAAG